MTNDEIIEQKELIDNEKYNYPMVRVANYLCFSFLGISVAIWGAIIPYVKQNVQVEPAMLGMLLFCVGFGALTAMPFASSLAEKFGCKRVLVVSLIFNFFFLTVASVITNIYLLAVVLFILGMAVGTLDVVVNIQAVFIEKIHQKKLMSGFHAAYSIGAIVGSIIIVSLLSLNFGALNSVLIISLFVFVVLFYYSSPHFLPFGSENDAKHSHFVLPKGIVVSIGVLSFLVYMNEGVILDWSALFLVQERDMLQSYSAIAFGFFATTTTIGRLFGDKISHKYGVAKLLIWGTIIALFGYATILLTNSYIASLIGFAIVGLGTANLIPQFFSLCAKQDKMPLQVAIASVSMIGFLGLLLGPVIMGFVGEAINLMTIFFAMALCLIVIFFLMPQIMKNIKQE